MRTASGGDSASPLWQQRSGDALPLGVERIACDVAAGALVPVAGVSEVAFLAVKVRVDPRAARIVDVLCDGVRAVPVAARVVPERTEENRHRRRLGGR